MLKPRVVREVARITLDGYLTKTGWLRTVCSGEIVDANGEPLPWATLPFVEFVGPRLGREMHVFEYGAGASTRYFASRVAKVCAVEHDPVFAEKLRGSLPTNASVVVRREESEEYLAEIQAMSPDIVSIDGRRRVECAEYALRHVSSNGVIFFDDTERAEYSVAINKITAAGFRRIDFWGMSPGSELHRCTTVFYRSENVLGI